MKDRDFGGEGVLLVRQCSFGARKNISPQDREGGAPNKWLNY